MATVDGTLYSVGDARHEFTIQSISKAFAYGLAVRELGLDAVLAKVDVEPSGDPFDELSLEPSTGRPRNPMINAGAITTHAMIGGPDISPMGRFEAIHRLLCDLAGRELAVDDEVWRSEMTTSDRNLAIAHLLRSHAIASGDSSSVSPRASDDGRRTRNPAVRHCPQYPFAVSGRAMPCARSRSRSASIRSYNSSASTRRSSPPR